MKKPKNFSIALENYITEPQFFAIRALEEGKATDVQQKVALKAIAENIGEFLQVSYEPDPMATAFNEGKRWVARFLFEVITAPVTYFKAQKNQSKRPNINQ
jgi:hypothetical protein